MVNVLPINANTFTRPGQIIQVSDKDDNTGNYLLVHKAGRKNETGFLCVPIKELTTAEASEARKAGNPMVFSMNTAEEKTTERFSRATQVAKDVRHFQIDTADPVILLDKGQKQGSKIVKAIDAPERLAGILQSISNIILTANKTETVAAYKRVFTPEEHSASGLTAKYDRLAGDYVSDKIKGHIKNQMRHSKANANLRDGKAVDDEPSVPGAE